MNWSMIDPWTAETRARRKIHSPGACAAVHEQLSTTGTEEGGGGVAGAGLRQAKEATSANEEDRDPETRAIHKHVGLLCMKPRQILRASLTSSRFHRPKKPPRHQRWMQKGSTHRPSSPGCTEEGFTALLHQIFVPLPSPVKQIGHCTTRQVRLGTICMHNPCQCLGVYVSPGAPDVFQFFFA